MLELGNFNSSFFLLRNVHLIPLLLSHNGAGVKDKGVGGGGVVTLLFFIDCRRCAMPIFLLQ